MQWEVVIGLATHVQLSTRSKIFSGAARHFGDEPNVNACYVDLALPGSLPVLNHSAVEKAIRFGLAIDATVANHSVFDRKYLDYQVNIGNRIIQALQTGLPEAAADAQRISEPKKRFQDIIDKLFAETGKKIVRTENEICVTQIGERLLPYQLSSGEKQLLAILLTVLVQDNKPYVLFMDEPEVSMHVDWQQQLIDLILELNPSVQIILTTHSPAVIMNGWMDKVTEVSDITV